MKREDLGRLFARACQVLDETTAGSERRDPGGLMSRQ
jgi:hypothetical protein